MTPPEPAVAQRPAGTLPQHNSNTLHCAEPCLGGGSETAAGRAFPSTTRRLNMRSYRICAFALGLLASAFGASAQSLHYSVTDLGIIGTPKTTAPVDPFGITNRGLIAGG